jgi:MFS family permease
MSSSQNANMFICARVIAGVGIGFIHTIIPPWISEIAKAHNRSAHFAIIFTSNCKYLFQQGLLFAHMFRYRYHYRVLDQLWSSKLSQ